MYAHKGITVERTNMVQTTKHLCRLIILNIIYRGRLEARQNSDNKQVCLRLAKIQASIKLHQNLINSKIKLIQQQRKKEKKQMPTEKIYYSKFSISNI